MVFFFPSWNFESIWQQVLASCCIVYAVFYVYVVCLFINIIDQKFSCLGCFFSILNVRRCNKCHLKLHLTHSWRFLRSHENIQSKIDLRERERDQKKNFIEVKFAIWFVRHWDTENKESAFKDLSVLKSNILFVVRDNRLWFRYSVLHFLTWPISILI